MRARTVGACALKPSKGGVTLIQTSRMLGPDAARVCGGRLRKYAEDIWSAAFILLGLRYSRELARHLLRGVRSMKESVTYQAILEEGEEKGKIEGALAEARKFLL